MLHPLAGTLKDMEEYKQLVDDKGATTTSGKNNGYGEKPYKPKRPIHSVKILVKLLAIKHRFSFPPSGLTRRFDR
jgi:hypothetical protein